MNTEIRKYQEIVREFAQERDWDQFHSPKNLAMALSVEVSELMEHFQWIKSEDSENLTPEKKLQVANEMVDIIIYWLRLADKLNINFEESFERKFKENIEKYPVDLVKGSSKKYNEY